MLSFRYPTVTRRLWFRYVDKLYAREKHRTEVGVVLLFVCYIVILCICMNSCLFIRATTKHVQVTKVTSIHNPTDTNRRALSHLAAE